MEDTSFHPWILNSVVFVLGSIWLALLAFVGKVLFARVGVKKETCPYHGDCMRRIDDAEGDIRVLRTRAVDKDDFKSLKQEWGEKIDALLSEVRSMKPAFVRAHPQIEFGDDIK